MRLSILAIGLLISFIGNCCSCVPPPKINDDQYNQYNLILKGKIVKVTETGDRISGERMIYIKVDVYYKGSQKIDTIKIISPRESGVCGIFPVIGESWLMYAYADGDKFKTNLCTRTKNMNSKTWDYRGEELKEDLEFLEAKRKTNGG